MPQSLSNILVHLVFSTKNRRAFIAPEVEEELWRYLSATCTAHGCQAHRVGGTVDHVHILCGLGRTIPVSKLLEEVKTSSSKWMKAKGVGEFGQAGCHAVLNPVVVSVDVDTDHVDGGAQ